MNVGSKLGIYEFLTMFVSGALILFILVSLVDTHQCHCGCSDVIIEIEGWNVFLFSVVAFTLGLIWHRLIECIRSIWSEKSCKNADPNSEHTKPTRNWTCCEFISMFFKTIIFRNSKTGIEYAKGKAGNNTLSDYYTAYDKVVAHGYENTIKQLEVQEAFLRDVWFPLVTFVILAMLGQISFVPSIDIKCPIIVVCGLIVLILILIARYQTQMNIFRAVWECSRIVEEREKNKK